MAVVALLGALAIIEPACSSVERLSSADPEAQVVAEAVARAWIDGRGDEVRQYISRVGPGYAGIERDHDFFVAHEFVIVGPARFEEKVGLLSGPGYSIPVLGLDGRRNVEDAELIHWTIGVELVREDDSWKVVGLDYTAGSPVE